MTVDYIATCVLSLSPPSYSGMTNSVRTLISLLDSTSLPYTPRGAASSEVVGAVSKGTLDDLRRRYKPRRLYSTGLILRRPCCSGVRVSYKSFQQRPPFRIDRLIVRRKASCQAPQTEQMPAKQTSYLWLFDA